jgi:hypothetical protein
MEEAPGTSIEHLSQQLGVSVGLTSHLFKNYIQLISPKRLEYCQWFLNTLDVHLDKIFYTDEAYLVDMSTLKIQECGVQKIHIFSLKHSSTHPQKVGIWAAISQPRIIGPIFFEGNNCNNVLVIK